MEGECCNISLSGEVRDLVKRKVKKCIIQRKKKVNKEFGREMNEDVNGSRKLF